MGGGVGVVRRVLGQDLGGGFIGALGLRWGHFFGIGVGVHRGIGFKVGPFFGTGVGVHRGPWI